MKLRPVKIGQLKSLPDLIIAVRELARGFSERDPVLEAIVSPDGQDNPIVRLGTTAGTAAEGNDPRLSDARKPLPHAETHQVHGSDTIRVDGLAGVLADPQNPVAHALTHRHGGSDPLAASEIGAADINHTHNASDIVSGLLPTSHGGTAADGSALPSNEFLASGTGGAISAAHYRTIVPDDLGTGTADATKFLRGDQVWATPPAGGGPATASALGSVKISGTPTDPANPVTYVKEQSDTLLAGKAATSHTHNASDITAGLLATSRGGTAADGSALPAGKFLASSASAGSSAAGYRSIDPLDIPALPESKITNLTTDLASKLNATDPSVTNARTPTAHASTHGTGGTDPVSPASIGAAATSHTHNASDITGGLLPTSRGGTAADGSALAANQVLASPDGASGGATYRSLAAGDIPAIPESRVTSLVTDLSNKAPLSHTHNASDIVAGLLPTSRGGTAADGSALAANLALASPNGASGAATYRALVEADITNLVSDLAAKEKARLKAVTTSNQAVIGTSATTITGMTLALLAGKKYAFKGCLLYVCTVTSATLAARMKYSGTLAATSGGQSMFRVTGSSGVPTAWAAAYREVTAAINSAIATATGGPGATGSAAVAILKIDGIINVSTAGNLDLEVVGSAASSITPQAGSFIEAWEVP